MDQGQLLFHERLRRLSRQHRALARGYRAEMRPDGLIVLTARRKFGPISPRPFATSVLIFVLFKGLLIATLGPQAYDARVAQLRVGTGVERAGAALMQLDPVSRTVAQAMGLP